MKKVYVVFLLILLAQSAIGATYFVSISGNDGTGDGSIDKPWRTLKYAVSKVASNQGHVIKVSAGIFIEAGRIDVPAGVSIEGAGKDATILKIHSSYYYYPSSPAYATDKFLISLSENSLKSGNQYLKNFTIDGDGKKLHGGIYVKNRSFVTIDGVKVTATNFTGIWLWDVKDSRLTNTDIINCSWGSSAYCVGALNLGNLERVEIDHCYIDENVGYGIKAIGPTGYNDILYTKIHDCTVTVNPNGLWDNGSAPNFSIELWMVDAVESEIYNCYIDNNISLIDANARPVTGKQTIRVHHNILDMDARAKGSGYSIELTMHDVEIDHNYFFKGSYAIANWGEPSKDWNIHHNVFYAIQGTWPGDILRSQHSGLHNVNFFNNTIEFTGTRTANIIGLYGGASENVNVKNNLMMDNNTSYSYYPNQFVHLENGASITGLTATHNLFYKLPIGTIPGTYNNNLTGDPAITQSGSRPDPYYRPKNGSPLIDAGTNVGLSFSGSAPDIGAYEYEGTPPVNTPPVVSITSPANNASFPFGNPISITANASDSNGSITKVEFYSGTSKIGEDLTAPYSITWNNVASGSYIITAKATDNSNAVTSSSPVTITVIKANVPPAITITSPENNATFEAGSSVTITANASDSDGSVTKVEFYNGTSKIGEDLTAPYSITWNNVASGSYIITAKATDNSNAVTTSSPVTITVIKANVPPAITITSPENNSTFEAGSSVTITANASDSDGTITKVEFYSGTSKIGEDLTAPYSLTWNNVALGSHIVTVKATDNSNAVTTSSPVTITVVKANVPPAITTTSPSNNTTFEAGSSVTITANASDSDGTITKVEFFSGTSKIGEDITAPYSLTWNNVAAGSHIITVKATDNSNAVTTSSPVTITVVKANVPPAITITSPSNNTTFEAGSSVTITANASDSDGTITKVEFFSGTSKIGEDITAPYSLTWNNVAAGSHIITVKATDNSNAVTTSSPVTITVVKTNVPPAITITSPSNNSTFEAGSSVTITANASDSDGTITKVEFYSGTSKIGEDLTAPYSITWNNVASGSYIITAKATDNSNAVTSSSPVTITVIKANVPPTITITSPENNSSFEAGSSVTITANASDSDGTITKVEFYSGTSKIGEDLTAPYSLTWNNVAAGSHIITVKATDNSNAVTTSSPVTITVIKTNVTPAVTITSPSNNSTFEAGSSVTITANASDSDGTITKVEFYSGTSKIGEDLTAPYSLTWNNVAAGSHIITVKATDNSNAVTTSSPVTITVIKTNVPPAVTITSPNNNSTFEAGSSVTITANASDSDGSVTKIEFYSGTSKIGEDITAPYSITWNNVASGSHIITAKATDNSHAITTSSPVTITVIKANVSPAITITSPENNSTFEAGSSVTITANASDSDGSVTKVEFYSGNSKIGEDLTAPYSIIWNNVISGSHIITAKATDNSHAITTSSPVTITVIKANVPPAIAITSPENNSSFEAGSSVTISANASDSDGSVTKVEFYSGNSKIGEDMNAPYSISWNNLAPGVYLITAKAVDNNNLATSDGITIHVSRQNMSPIADAGADIVIILPDNSVTLHGSGTDEDGRIVRYEWTQSSGPRNATIKSESGGDVSITDLIQGTYIFRLSVTDDHGLQGYDDITVTAVKAADEKYTIPRYFTPNSDGINDVWTWQMTDALRNASVTIFNRFGQKVFESAVYENNWDGKLNGKPLEQDAYYYVIRTDSQTLNGAVRIIK